MTVKQSLALRVKACALIFLSELKRKSESARDLERKKAIKRLSTFSKYASEKGCDIEDILYNYILGCIYRKKAFFGINFIEALSQYEEKQVCKKVYSQPTKLYQEIKRLEIKNQVGITEVYQLRRKVGRYVKGKHLYNIPGKVIEPVSTQKGSHYTQYVVQEENRAFTANPIPEYMVFHKEIGLHYIKLVRFILRDYKLSLTNTSRRSLDALIDCHFTAEYLSSSQARKDKAARQFSFSLDNLHRNSLFKGKINRVEYLTLLRKYRDPS
jgi:hypothetical protein